MRVVAYLYSDLRLEAMPTLAPPGWSIDQVYQDQVETRPQWQQLLQDAQTKPIDCVLLRRLADLGDSLGAVGDRLQDLAIRHIRWLTLEADPPAALSAAGVQMLHNVQQTQQQRRLQQGHARNRLAAQPPPGKAPYGYRRSKHRYVIDRATAPVVKDFFEQFLLYGSVRGATRYLAKQYGKKISASTAHRWLTSPVYRGDLAYHTGDIVPDTHAALLSREEAAQIDRLLRRNRQLPPRTASAPRSLAGLVTCAHCQSPLTVTRVAPRRAQEYLYLRSRQCPQQPKCAALPYLEVLQRTIDQICTDLPAAVASVALPPVAQALRAAIAAKQDILAELPPLVARGVLDQATADLRIAGLQTEIAALRAQLTQLPPPNLQAIAQTVSLPQFWLDLSETERRFYLREFIRQIEVIRQSTDSAKYSWQLRLIFIF